MTILQGDTDDTPLEIASLPNWTPDSVRNAIQTIEQMNLSWNYRPILRRLAFDERMETIWAELSKRSKSGQFLHQGRPQDRSDLSTEDDLQSAALSEVFLFVLIVAYEQYPVVKAGEITKAGDNSLRHSEALRAVASDMALALKEGKLGLTDNYESKLLAENDLSAILRVAEWHENCTKALRKPGDPLMIEKHRGDPVERGVHISIANKLFFIFGKRLDRTAATLASVVLGVKIGVRAARSALTKTKKEKNAKSENFVQGEMNVDPPSDASDATSN
jgi:hypothetical protein